MPNFIHALTLNVQLPLVSFPPLSTQFNRGRIWELLHTPESSFNLKN